MIENEAMDQAAEKAKAELDANFNTWSAKELAQWWAENFGKAGYKRLGRLLVEKVKK